MSRVNPGRIGGSLIVVALLLAPLVAHPDALSVVQMLRAGGCGGIVALAPPLRHDAYLDRAAEEWADGHALDPAAQGVHASGSDETLIRQLRRSDCRAVSSRDLRDVGIYHRGADTWLVLAAAAAPGASYRLPPASAAPAGAPSKPRSALPRSATPAMAARALQLVNEARARGAQCGAQSFEPAPPLTLSGTLAGVARGHAADMAVHDYFEHQDLSGHSPADRVRAAGYHEKLVGENIAYGPKSVEEAVQGWLRSADHCQNIMDPRFAQMGLGLAPGRAARRGLFWVQLLAEPGA
ncbi:MAG TPA: CAP domain-containing protein [Steroidobacteraceae bacterium]|nr:CAP domain-containing protein [Steroidobacteraceae bacterium]